MALKRQFVELTARRRISCKECHVIADITVGDSPIVLTALLSSDLGKLENNSGGHR